MGPILNKEPSNKEIQHNDDNDDNNNTDISFIPEKVDSPYLKRKRKIPDGGGKEFNQLNKNISSKIISQLKQELEENEKKAQDLKEEIIKNRKN